MNEQEKEELVNMLYGVTVAERKGKRLLLHKAEHYINGGKK